MTKYFGVPFAVSGDKTAVPDALQPGGKVSYTEGWTADYEADQTTDPNAKDVDRQAENQLKFDITDALKEMQERGFKVYDALVNYPVDSYTLGSDGNPYRSLIANGPASTVVDPVGDLTGTWIPAIGVVNTVVFTAGGVYNPPAGVRALELTVVGGGGGGGGVNGGGGGTSNAGAGGGGAGSSILATTIIDASYTITIGAGGAGGSGAASGTGSAGGTTSITSANVNISASGGTGGAGMPVSVGYWLAAAGIGGSGSGGDVNTRGDDGFSAILSGSITVTLGNSGASKLGGARFGSAVSSGPNGITFGAGGAGAGSFNSFAINDGGGGADGVVLIKEFF